MVAGEPELGVYEHFRGGRVRLIHVATHSEMLERFAVYEMLYKGKTGDVGSIWIRPLKMFVEMVEDNGRKVPRFRRIEN